MESSNRSIKYVCTRCGTPQPREQLTVKRAMFQTMGEGYKTLRSRTVDWLCVTCRESDPAWLQTALTSAPGNADLSREKGR